MPSATVANAEPVDTDILPVPELGVVPEELPPLVPTVILPPLTVSVKFLSNLPTLPLTLKVPLAFLKIIPSVPNTGTFVCGYSTSGLTIVSPDNNSILVTTSPEPLWLGSLKTLGLSRWKPK